MAKLFYYKKYDTPIKYVSEISGKECESTGKWVCDHPLVERCYNVGRTDQQEKSGVEMITGLVMKDGGVKEFKNDFDHSKVNKYLNELDETTQDSSIFYPKPLAP